MNGMNAGWDFVWENRGLLWSGFLSTLLLTVVTIVTATVLGFLVGLGRYARIPGLNVVLRVYLEIFRGTPLLVQLLFVYFGAAFLNWEAVTVFAAAVIAVTLYQGAYISEIFRAGLDAVPIGQRESAQSLGLSRFHIMKDVVFPQTMPVVLPPLFGQYLTLVKNTSLASVISYFDLVRQGQSIIDRGGNSFDIYIVIAALYFIISYPLSIAARGLEKRSIRAREKAA